MVDYTLPPANQMDTRRQARMAPQGGPAGMMSGLGTRQGKGAGSGGGQAYVGFGGRNFGGRGRNRNQPQLPAQDAPPPSIMSQILQQVMAARQQPQGYMPQGYMPQGGAGPAIQSYQQYKQMRDDDVDGQWSMMSRPFE